MKRYNAICENVDNLQQIVLKDLLENGETVYPRGKETKELLAYSILLINLRKRMAYNSERKFSLIFVIGELFWYLSGSDEFEKILYYNKRYKDFSDDDIKLYDAYGKQLFNDELSLQINRVIRALRKDKNSRQALISFFNSNDLNKDSEDIPCTCTIQHFVCSIHIYKEYYKLAESMIKWKSQKKLEMKVILERLCENISNLIKNEIIIRKNGLENIKLIRLKNKYFLNIQKILFYLKYKKEKKVENTNYLKMSLPDYFSVLLKDV